MKFRLADVKDYQNIYQLVKTAFETAKVSDGNEQDFVLKLRDSDNFIPELEFVCENENELIGHIMMTHQVIDTNNGDYLGLLVAPLCVKLENRNNGIGGALIKYAYKEALRIGYKAVFLVGDPNYYGKFGYRQISEFKIVNNTEIPDQFILGCELIPGALTEVEGSINIFE